LPVRGRPSGFSDAILDSLAYLGGPWKFVARAGRLVPRRIRNEAYRLFASNRRYFGWLSLAEFDEQVESRTVLGLADNGWAEGGGPAG